MDKILALLLAGLGIILIYAGYQLFCGLPALALKQPSRRAVLLLNLVPGAILALVGAGLLAAEVHQGLSQRQSRSAKPSRDTTRRPTRSVA